MTERPALAALAAHAGILDGYHSALDGAWVVPSDATREALLAAMGHDASSEASAGRRLAELEAEARAARLDPVCVVVAGRPGARGLALRHPHAGAAQGILRNGAVEGELRGETGEVRAFEEMPDPQGVVQLPELAPGRWEIALRAGGEELRQLRWVVPGRCSEVDALLGGGGGFGLCVNLYSVRSDANWGFGNLGDLAELARRAGREGAAFVGLNPLHALAPGDVCPYLPVSRLHRHVLYLDPERIPELEHCPEARRLLGRDVLRARRAAARGAARLDAGAVSELIDPLLRALHRCFAAGACGPERTAAFARYREEQGPRLRDFATFSALADHFEAQGAGRDWRGWPEPFRSPGSAAVREFRATCGSDVERHAWLQFELDRQLGEAAAAAREAGLALGLYTDLALGSDPGGADAWSLPELVVRGVRVGAPPDGFSQEGQEWGFPPLDPAALRGQGYGPWVDLLRAGFRHAGALRLDHAMGLRRLFWIPEGSPPSEGAYVGYPAEDLLGLVALESRRHGAAVIAEDLGTVPEGFADELASRGILSSRVLYFERDGDAFRTADRYPAGCLVTANTHDLPPLAALAGEEDLELRRRAGQLPDDEALDAARSERRTEREALLRRLREDGLLGEDPPDAARLAEAVTAFLCSTPARLVGLSLDDLAGEGEPVNLPGVPPERHASWTRRLGPGLDALWDSPPARACLAAVPDSRRGAG